MRKIVIDNIYNDTFKINSPTTFNSCENIRVIPNSDCFKIQTRTLINIINDFETNSRENFDHKSHLIHFNRCKDVMFGKKGIGNRCYEYSSYFNDLYYRYDEFNNFSVLRKGR